MAEVTRTTTVTVTTSPAGVVTTTTVTEAFNEPQDSVPTATKTDTKTEVGTVDIASIGSGAAAEGGKKSKKQAKKEAKKEKKQEKKQEKKEEATPSGLDPKAAKAAYKEGGKKGQDLAGMADMGGIRFFHVALENCDGNFDLVNEAMKGANVVVDETSEERKGGAGELGKMFFSASVQQLVIICHVPAARTELSIDDWVEAVNKEVKGEVVEKSSEWARIVAKLDESKERFPLKMRDAGINAGFALLRSKQLVMDDDDSDDDLDYAALQEEAGIEW